MFIFFQKFKVRLSNRVWHPWFKVLEAELLFYVQILLWDSKSWICDQSLTKIDFARMIPGIKTTPKLT